MLRHDSRVPYSRRPAGAGIATRRSIQAAVRRGELIHVRRDRYLAADANEQFARAVRVGGRLTCLSLLALLGVFVLSNRDLHVHVDRGVEPPQVLARRRSSRGAGSTRHGSASRLHWTNLIEAAGSSCSVQVLDALAHAVAVPGAARQPSPRSTARCIRGSSSRVSSQSCSPRCRPGFAAPPARRRPGGVRSGDPRSTDGAHARLRYSSSRSSSTGSDASTSSSTAGSSWSATASSSTRVGGSRSRPGARHCARGQGYCTLRLTAATIMYRPDDAFAAIRRASSSRAAE